MKKRTLEHMLALVLCLCLLLPGGAAAASRQTSPAAAYQSGTVMEIATAEDLKLFAQQVAVDRGTDGKLVADIDLTMEGVWNPMGGSWDSDGYSGTFDGNGHTITGLHGGSLFNTISGEGSVRDLTLAEVNVTGSAPLARLSFGTVENCHAEGRLRAIDIMYIGGLVARVEEGAVLNSSATVDITAECTESGAENFGYYEVGGVAGYLGGRMDSCTYTGDITATGLVPGCGIMSTHWASSCVRTSRPAKIWKLHAGAWKARRDRQQSPRLPKPNILPPEACGISAMRCGRFILWVQSTET